MPTKTVSTPPVIALFLILSVSGIMLMSHAGGGSTKAVHEWLGIAFILFGILHSLTNWNLTRRYLQGMKGIFIATAVAASLAFSSITPSATQAPPIKTVFTAVLQAPLKNVAALYDTKPETFVDLLRNKGYSVAGIDRSLEDIARDNGTQPDTLLSCIVARPEGNRR